MDPFAAEAAAVEAGLTGKDPIQATDWLAANNPDPDQRLIAAMVAKKLREMAQLGVKFKLTIAQVGDKVPSALMGARGLNVYTFGKPGANPAEMHVWLNGSTVTGKIGVSYETALHEIVHSATVAAIRSANMKANTGTPSAASVSVSELLHIGQQLLEANINSLEHMAGAAGMNFSINAPAGQMTFQNVQHATPGQPEASACFVGSESHTSGLTGVGVGFARRGVGSRHRG